MRLKLIKNPMKVEKKKILNLLGWISIAFAFSLSILLYFLGRPISQISRLFNFISYVFRPYALLIHVIFLTVVILSFIFKKVKDELFIGLVSSIAFTTAIIAIFFMLISDAIIFLSIGILALIAYFTNQIKWDFHEVPNADLLFGMIGIVFGFWYLHWTEEPIYLNALFLSAMGILNSPSLFIICGFLCLSKEPRSKMLEASVIFAAFWYGILGVFFLGNYINSILILLAFFLSIRTIKNLRKEKNTT